MAVHFDLLERFSRESAAAAAPEATWQQRSVLLNMVVHLADLCNPSRPFPLARRWAELVVSEFLQQVGRPVRASVTWSLHFALGAGAFAAATDRWFAVTCRACCVPAAAE